MPRVPLPPSTWLIQATVLLALGASAAASAQPAPATPPKPASEHRNAAPHTGSHEERKATPVIQGKAAPPKQPPPGRAATAQAAPKGDLARHPRHAKPPPAAAAPAPQPSPEPAPAKESAPAAEPPPKGTATGLPLPRFAALRSDEVNLRSGPGTRYPIEWVYKRRDLPVEIEREFEVWRLIKDQEGVKGWVHQATLTGRRSFVVTGAERTLRRSPADDAAAVAILKPGVIGRMRACQPGTGWCEVQVGEYRGFLRRDEFWGSYPAEAVNQ